MKSVKQYEEWLFNYLIQIIKIKDAKIQMWLQIRMKIKYDIHIYTEKESEQTSKCSFCNKLTSMVNLLVWLIPGGYVVKTLPVNTGDTSSIPGLRRSPWEGNGNPL